MSTDNCIKINNKRFYKTLIKVASPIALQSLITSSLGLVDNLMVGHLGEVELAAVGIGVQIYLIHWMVMFGFTSGSGTFMAQFWGAGDLVSIRKTTGFAIAVTGCVSILFFVAAAFAPRAIVSLFTESEAVIVLSIQYVKVLAISFLTVSFTVPFTMALRATQQTKVPMFISFAVFGTNTFMNYVLIFGHFGAPALGVMGAGLATAMARCLELALVVIVVFVKKNVVAGNFADFCHWNKTLMIKIIKNALPTTLNESLWGLGQSTYMAAYGHVSVTAFAAVQACNNINNVFIMAGFSLGDAVLILVGQKLGENKKEEAYAMTAKLLRTALVVGLAGGLLQLLFAGPLIGLFNFTDKGMEFCRLIIIVYACYMPIELYVGAQITGVLRCGGDTMFAMTAELSCVWLYGVPMAFVSTMVLGLPVYWAVAIVLFEEVIKSAILTWRFYSKKWLNNVVNDIVEV